MRFASLGSGSGGNASVVGAGGMHLLVDCGFSLREVKKRLQRLDLDVTQIQAVLVTHEHSDHCKGVPMLARQMGIPVYATRGTYDAMRAFGSPFSLLIREFSGPGLLDYEVESRGKVFLCPELGGSGTLEPYTLRVAELGVRNVLRHFGVMPGEPTEVDVPVLEQSQLLEVPDTDHYYLARISGIFEPTVRIGDEVANGQLLGRIHSLDDAERDPYTVYARQEGIVLGRRAPGVSSRGDCVALIARVIEEPVAA